LKEVLQGETEVAPAEKPVIRRKRPLAMAGV
jgi:hypothetical protein